MHKSMVYILMVVVKSAVVKECAIVVNVPQNANRFTSAKYMN